MRNFPANKLVGQVFAPASGVGDDNGFRRYMPIGLCAQAIEAMMRRLEDVRVHQLRILLTQEGKALPGDIGRQKDAPVAKGDVEHHAAVIHGNVGNRPVIVKKGKRGFAHFYDLAICHLVEGHPLPNNLGYGVLMLRETVIHWEHRQENARQIIPDQQLPLGEDMIPVGGY